MIPYTPHPILFSLGPVDIRFYSLAYIAGFLLVYAFLRKRIGKDKAEDALIWLVLATIIGGRLGYFFFYSISTFWTDPLEVLLIWHGGMSFHGALIMLIAAFWWWCKKRGEAFWSLADVLVLPAAIALGLGRIANFLNGELLGPATNVPWCVQLPQALSCVHPSPLYEAMYSFAIAGILYWQSKKKHEAGFMFWLFVFLYGVLRTIVNIWRDEPRILLGLSEGQLLSLIMALIAAIVISRKYKKSVSRVLA